MTLPNFLIIGPPRSGTTWMYEAFAAHPEVHMSPKKEIQFFFFPNYRRGLQWYERFFSGAGKARWLGEATPYYLHVEQSATLIHRHLPNAHLFCCLRNPIDRLVSHYFHHINMTNWDPKVDINCALADPPSDLTEPGFYGRHLSRYLGLFPRHRIHILFFDDLRGDATAFARQMYGCLGIDASFIPPAIGGAVNARKTMKPTAPLRRKLYERLYAAAHASYESLSAALSPASVEAVRKALPIRQLFDLMREARPRAKLTLETHRWLAQLYWDDVRIVEQLTGRCLDQWLEYEE